MRPGDLRKQHPPKRKTQAIPSNNAPSTKPIVADIGSKKQQLAFQEFDKFREEHHDTGLPNLGNTYRNQGSNASSHHCPHCHKAATHRCFTKGHVGTCPRCGHIASMLKKCSPCREKGIIIDRMIPYPPLNWVHPNEDELKANLAEKSKAGIAQKPSKAWPTPKKF